MLLHRSAFALWMLAALACSAIAQPTIVDQTTIGMTNSLRCFEHNGARHIARDAQGRVHMLFLDGTDAWYLRGEQSRDGRVSLTAPQRINDDASTIYLSTQAGLPSTRGAALAIYDGPGETVVHFVWTTRPGTAIITYRRVTEQGGSWTWGPIVSTNMDARLPTVAVDSTGRVHVAAEHSYDGDYSSIHYATSTNGLSFAESAAEYRAATGSWNYRFPTLVVDQQDRVHMVFQAEGYQGDGPNTGASWWAPRYMILDGGVWTGQPNPLGSYPEWGPPPAYRDVLFAYPCLSIDSQNNLHLVWHGTARSGLFAKDDTFHLASYYQSGSDMWGSWTDLTTLHQRIHYDVPGGPIVSGGEDYNYTWVPSLADDPSTGQLQVMLMFGLFDDEIGPGDTSVATEAGLVFFDGSTWQLDLLNLTNTPGGRNWYPNCAPSVYLHPNGRRYLDMLWIDGVHDPNDIYARNYEVIYSTLDLDPPPALVSSEPAADGTLPKTENNVIRLTFDSAIMLPAGSALHITQFDDPNHDVSGLFDYQIDPNDPAGVTLEATESGAALANRTWYSVTPSPDFRVQPFALDVCTLRGDANGSARVTTADYSEVKAHMGERTDARCDLNGNGRITTADYGVVKTYLGNRQPTKP
ncbi:MAG TPA: dockerin type I repeat-containing protein [Phycisphaerae bacterium]|nr:dockerin type I repeat-containing protein [Phycisphaerae bacterium]